MISPCQLPLLLVSTCSVSLFEAFEHVSNAPPHIITIQKSRHGWKDQPFLASWTICCAFCSAARRREIPSCDFIAIACQVEEFVTHILTTPQSQVCGGGKLLLLQKRWLLILAGGPFVKHLSTINSTIVLKFYGLIIRIFTPASLPAQRAPVLYPANLFVTNDTCFWVKFAQVYCLQVMMFQKAFWRCLLEWQG